MDALMDDEYSEYRINWEVLPSPFSMTPTFFTMILFAGHMPPQTVEDNLEST